MKWRERLQNFLVIEEFAEKEDAKILWSDAIGVDRLQQAGFWTGNRWDPLGIAAGVVVAELGNGFCNDLTNQGFQAIGVNP